MLAIQIIIHKLVSQSLKMLSSLTICGVTFYSLSRHHGWELVYKIDLFLLKLDIIHQLINILFFFLTYC